MPELTLTPAQRRALRAEAHALNPVVLMGTDGLTPAVQAEVDRALTAHALIKVRVAQDDRSQREAVLQTLTQALNAAAVQHIGKLLVLWRPLPAPALAERVPDKRPARVVRLVRYGEEPGKRPQVSTVKVLGNERLTAGGQIKRAKTRQTSVKKQAATAPARKP